MRIRKRFPLSSMASSVSDPQLNNSTLVQQTSSLLHPIHNMAMQHKPNTDSQPSDQHPSSDQTPMMMINNTLHPHKFEINQKVCLVWWVSCHNYIMLIDVHYFIFFFFRFSLCTRIKIVTIVN